MKVKSKWSFLFMWFRSTTYHSRYKYNYDYKNLAKCFQKLPFVTYVYNFALSPCVNVWQSLGFIICIDMTIAYNIWSKLIKIYIKTESFIDLVFNAYQFVKRTSVHHIFFSDQLLEIFFSPEHLYCQIYRMSLIECGSECVVMNVLMGYHCILATRIHKYIPLSKWKKI